MLKYYDEVLDGGLAKLVRSRLGEELIVLLLLRSLRLGQSPATHTRTPNKK